MGPAPRFLTLAVLTSVLAGCGALMPSDTGQGTADTELGDAGPATEVVETVVAEPIAPIDLWSLIARDSTWRAPDKDPEIASARDRYLQQPQLSEVISERAEPHLQTVVAAVRARGLPIELALVPVIESMLDPWAYSSAHAAGLWQITSGTASHYGLRRTWWYDARYDVAEATEFALDYLEALNARFDGDWFLTLAAYNSGPGRVSRAITRAEENGLEATYWSLDLPRETRRYVPRLLAMAEIIRERATLGIALPSVPIDARLVPVAVAGQIEMERAAQLAGLPLEELRRLNPGQLRWATARGPDQVLWLPESLAKPFARKLAQLAPEDRVQWVRYTIEPGDTLTKISRRMGAPVTLIREINDIEGHLIRAGDSLMIPGSLQGENALALARIGPERGRRPGRYEVKSGDSLWSISRRFGLDLDALQQWNQLAPDRYLQPGQTLRLRP
ncbi:lytic transglycosylase, catalytic [Luminiphilus syltensis NOR5-1B]|uniref:Lytic transglycosylase, catalytic n=1 Tax=Luminiphilus syltensis NOR5-1B TaxID=565045 RepID=B8KSD0_9GAMM|nr:LysM peptidoglycan-binding domain-containing protein [Luminiphilus syltensis]EED36597.1 lytic transglycosylase, catalytic [Luminiphilus syltensis NOR5-1B]